MNNSSARETGWKPCRTGEISDLIHRIRRRRCLAITTRAGIGVAIVLFVALLVPNVISIRSQLRGNAVVVGITCREVQDLADEYLAGSLAPQIRDEIDEHLAECAGCNAFINDLRRKKTMQRRTIEPQHDSSKSS